MVSLITVIKNGEKYFGQTIESVRNQTYSNIEYIVVDGGSTDGTLDILHGNTDLIDEWISEEDQGLYDAMNKGIALSNGDVIGIINSDDLLLPHCVETIIKEIISLGQPGYCCASVEIIDENGARLGRIDPIAESKRWRRRFLEMPCAHLGVFVHKDIYSELGVFDTRFQYSADYDFLLRLMSADAPFKLIYQPVAKFRLGGVSGGPKTWGDSYSVRRKNGAPISKSVYQYLRSSFKTFLAKIMPLSIKRLSARITRSKNFYD